MLFIRLSEMVNYSSMQFKTGQTVVRHDPGDHQTTWSIQNEKDVAYHSGLQERGYQYEDVSKGTEVDFDLPTPDVAPISKTRVHVSSEAVCVACEG